MIRPTNLVRAPRPTKALLALAQRVIWFESPDEALANPVRFLCYLMARSTPEDLAIAARTFSTSDFRNALRTAPPGILSRRAWLYWNLVLEGHARRPMPRRFEDVAPLSPWV